MSLTVPGVNRYGGASGRRSRTVGGSGQLTGAARPHGPLAHLHLTATLRAAAPHQLARGRSGNALVLRKDDLREAVRVVGGRAKLEASGGVRLDTVRGIAETGVDMISVGALTHSAPAMDLALDFD